MIKDIFSMVLVAITELHSSRIGLLPRLANSSLMNMESTKANSSRKRVTAC